MTKKKVKLFDANAFFREYRLDVPMGKSVQDAYPRVSSKYKKIFNVTSLSVLPVFK